MDDTEIAACYHPAQVLLIDDNPRYLEGLLMSLDQQLAHYRSYSEPAKALDFLKNKYTPDYFTSRCVLRPEEDERDHRSIDVNVRVIRDEMDNANRFKQVSVIVVDQEMPGLKGLELCAQLKSSPIKKLMLTGELKNEQAINAFNDGLIDRFIGKGSDDFADVLEETIAELQAEYFADLSTLVIDSLTQNPDHYIKSCLNDPVFVRFFHALREKYKLTEYYLADSNGSFLFLNSSGKLSLLAVKDDMAMAGAVFDAEVADEKPTKKIHDELIARKKILYLHNDDDWSVQAVDWDKRGFLHKAKQLEGGRQTYFYAYIDDLAAYV